MDVYSLVPQSNHLWLKPLQPPHPRTWAFCLKYCQKPLIRPYLEPRNTQATRWDGNDWWLNLDSKSENLSMMFKCTRLISLSLPLCVSVAYTDYRVNTEKACGPLRVEVKDKQRCNIRRNKNKKRKIIKRTCLDLNLKWVTLSHIHNKNATMKLHWNTNTHNGQCLCKAAVTLQGKSDPI